MAGRASLVPIFFVVLVDVLGLTMVIPLLAIYAEQFGASPLVATLLVSVFAACQLVSGPLLGRLSDRVGRRRVLLVSQLGTLIGFVLMARAEALWVLFVARAIDGATAGNLSVAQAYIADRTPPEKRARSFALIGVAFGIGFLVGPGITAQLSGFGLAAPFWAAAGLSALSVVLTATLLERDRPQDRAATAERRILDPGLFARYFRQRAVGPPLLQFFLLQLSLITFTSGFALFAERTFRWDGALFGPREIGWVFVYIGALGVFWQGGAVGRLVDRFGERAVAGSGLASLVGGFAVLGATDTLLGLGVSATLASYGSSVVRPSLTSLVSRAVPPDEQGTILGLTQSLTSLAAIGMPPVGGALLDAGLPGAWAWTAATAALAGALVGLAAPDAARNR